MLVLKQALMSSIYYIFLHYIIFLTLLQIYDKLIFKIGSKNQTYFFLIFLAFSSTSSAIFFLYALRVFVSPGFFALKIWAARMAACLAPDFPIAIVATGMPGGIWTVENRASTPLSGEESIGTPITGRIVCAAITPARCAALPAPAIITPIPFFSASAVSFTVLFGLLCAEAMV